SRRRHSSGAGSIWCGATCPCRLDRLLAEPRHESGGTGRERHEPLSGAAGRRGPPPGRDIPVRAGRRFHVGTQAHRGAARDDLLARFHRRSPVGSRPRRLRVPAERRPFRAPLPVRAAKGFAGPLRRRLRGRRARPPPRSSARGFPGACRRRAREAARALPAGARRVRARRVPARRRLLGLDLRSLSPRSRGFPLHQLFLDAAVHVSGPVHPRRRRPPIAARALLSRGLDGLRRVPGRAPSPPAKPSAGPRPVIGFIGRVVPIKDVKTFIRAMKAIVAERPEVEGWIVGPTSEDEAYATECRQLVSALGLDRNVKFLGFRAPEEILPQLGLLALTSMSEALPLVVLEAFASGLPVLTTDVGACREMVEGRTPEDR